uniref:Uncharacterized protein MANES_11G022200 n=1 Tax=Rhizophora mucronata TaxID=61149 RepID=A0A2P2MIY5_RHIMU
MNLSWHGLCGPNFFGFQDVIVTMDGICRELQRERQQELLLGSFISQSRQIEAERELEPWVPDEDDPQCPELENIFDGPRNRLLQYTFLSPDPLDEAECSQSSASVAFYPSGSYDHADSESRLLLIF